MKDFIGKRTPSDAIPVLRWAVMIFTLLITALVFWSATGKRFTDEILLPSVVAAYAAADLSYSLLSTLLYRERKRKEQIEKKNSNGNAKTQPSYGEFVGTGFVAVLFFVGLLAGFQFWNFKIMPDAAFVAIDITVAIITLASIAKIITLPKVQRKRHNSALYFLSVYTTGIILMLLTVDAFGGVRLVDDYLWSYSIILSSYVAHNVIFAIVRPGIPQKRHGELVALGVTVFTAGVYILNALDVAGLPRFITPFFMITIIILGVGAGGKFMLKDLIRRRIFGTDDESLIKNHLDHIEDYERTEDVDDCVDCDNNKEL
ncbi:MAG: hypothetical protein WDZ40_03930 [Candidatus Spechtbacterales bacterium]